MVMLYNSFVMREKKTYYSPHKEKDDAIYRPHIFYRLFCGILRLFFPKNELIWATDKPKDGEKYALICNHTKIYAPAYFLLQKEIKPLRLWVNYYFVYFNKCWGHLKNKVLNKIKGGVLLYPIGFILTPIIVLLFRAFNPIPVFHKCEETETMTFAKSVRTLEEDIPLLIFPERTVNPVNQYVYQFNKGFPMLAEKYYQETGKKLKFYPTYCAQKLRKVVIGKPIEYDPNESMETQSAKIRAYLENKIKELGDSLPEHEPVLYV